MDGTGTTRRRTVLKTIGTSVIGGVALTGSATAKGNNYGRGNAIGAFLTEDALFKDQPLWESGIADLTGESEVEILVGTPTSVDIPEEVLPPDVDPPEELPMAFEPKAVKISPGTEVTWSWPFPVHHSVTSFNEEADDPEDTTTTGDHGQLFDDHYHPPEDPQGPPPFHSFTYDGFDEVGTCLYFCHPHGTPYPAFDAMLGEEVENLFGMRGAVKVADD